MCQLGACTGGVIGSAGGHPSVTSASCITSLAAARTLPPPEGPISASISPGSHAPVMLNRTCRQTGRFVPRCVPVQGSETPAEATAGSTPGASLCRPLRQLRHAREAWCPGRKASRQGKLKHKQAEFGGGTGAGLAPQERPPHLSHLLGGLVTGFGALPDHHFLQAVHRKRRGRPHHGRHPATYAGEPHGHLGRRFSNDSILLVRGHLRGDINDERPCRGRRHLSLNEDPP